MHNYNLPKKLLILIVLYLLFSLNIFSNPIEIDKNYNKDITKESYIYIDKKLNTSIGVIPPIFNILLFLYLLIILYFVIISL